MKDVKYFRTVITITMTGEVLYGKFNALTPDELEPIYETFEHINKLTYLMIEHEDGSRTYIKGDSIAHIKLELSQR